MDGPGLGVPQGDGIVLVGFREIPRFEEKPALVGVLPGQEDFGSRPIAPGHEFLHLAHGNVDGAGSPGLALEGQDSAFVQGDEVGGRQGCFPGAGHAHHGKALVKEEVDEFALGVRALRVAGHGKEEQAKG